LEGGEADAQAVANLLHGAGPAHERECVRRRHAQRRLVRREDRGEGRVAGAGADGVVSGVPLGRAAAAERRDDWSGSALEAVQVAFQAAAELADPRRGGVQDAAERLVVQGRAGSSTRRSSLISAS